MTRVLVALDDSPVSLRAAREAARLFPHADFFVVNVTRVAVPWVAGWEYGTAYSVDASELPAAGLDNEDLSSLAAEAGLAAAEVIKIEGEPGHAICAAADDRDIDVIVVGSHDKGVLRRLLNPSVSQAVLHSTYRPVLVVNDVPSPA